MMIGKILGFLISFGKIADWLKMRIFKSQVARAHQEGRIEAKVEVFGEQQKQLDQALDSRAEFGNRLRSNPGSLRESDRFEIQEPGAGDKESGGLPSSSAPEVGQELARPSDPPSETA